MSREFTIEGRLESVKLALRGAWLLLRAQRNAWIHAAATLAMVTAGLYFDVAPIEWACLILATACVWTAEAFNTALELLADVASPEFHPLVGQAKDVAAAAVLFSAVGAAIVAVLILGPYVLGSLGRIPIGG
ncbi:MAG TPA: diacylglycerol kinase family protein [Vicinamibacteria bacterium]|nr:diacylglycerol kinase family protein [Vicinamibacteria bacterium]